MKYEPLASTEKKKPNRLSTNVLRVNSSMKKMIGSFKCKAGVNFVLHASPSPTNI